MLDKKDLKIEAIRGQGPGGQHRNKTASCIRITHVPTGTQVIIDGRNQHQNKKKALKVLEERLGKQVADKKAAAKKAIRDEKIKDTRYIRTYDFKRKEVKDHRTGKVASLKEVLYEGHFELLNP